MKLSDQCGRHHWASPGAVALGQEASGGAGGGYNCKIFLIKTISSKDICFQKTRPFSVRPLPLPNRGPRLPKAGRGIKDIKNWWEKHCPKNANFLLNSIF